MLKNEPGFFAYWHFTEAELFHMNKLKPGLNDPPLDPLSQLANLAYEVPSPAPSLEGSLAAKLNSPTWLFYKFEFAPFSMTSFTMMVWYHPGATDITQGAIVCLVRSPSWYTGNSYIQSN